MQLDRTRYKNQSLEEEIAKVMIIIMLQGHNDTHLMLLRPREKKCPANAKKKVCKFEFDPNVQNKNIFFPL